MKLKTDPAHPMLSKQAAVHPARSFQVSGAKKYPTEHHYNMRAVFGRQGSHDAFLLLARLLTGAA